MTRVKTQQTDIITVTFFGDFSGLSEDVGKNTAKIFSNLNVHDDTLAILSSPFSWEAKKVRTP